MNNQFNNHNKLSGQHEQGFTLVELMIALALGLIIMAAVAQVYLMSIRVSSVQQSASGVLDANVFGIQQIESSLRLAGLGLADKSASRQVGSGILIYTPPVGGQPLTGSNLDLERNFGMNLQQNLATRDGSEGLNFLHANTSSGRGDQLTLQYRAPVDMRDCEGKLALGPRDVITMRSSDHNDFKRVDGQVIVERYYVAKAQDGTGTHLYCDAKRYITEEIVRDPHPKTDAVLTNPNIAINTLTESTTATQNGVTQTVYAQRGQDAVILIPNVDDFQILLGVNRPETAGTQAGLQTACTQAGLQYVDPKQYYDSDTCRTQPIVSVRFAILARGATPTLQMGDTAVTQFKMLGKDVTLNPDAPTNYVRRVYESTVMLRNSRKGMSS